MCRPARDKNRDMAPDPEPDSSTQSPSVTSIIISMVAASWGKTVTTTTIQSKQYLSEEQMMIRETV